MKTIITAQYQYPGNVDVTLVRSTFDGQLSEHVAELVGLGLLWKVGASSSGEARVEHEHRDGGASSALLTDAELRDRVEWMQTELHDALGVTGQVPFDDLLVCVREQRRELQTRDAEVRRLRDRLCERPQFGGSQCALTFGTVADSSGIWVRAKDLRVGDRAGQDGATVEIIDHDGDWYAFTLSDGEQVLLHAEADHFIAVERDDLVGRTVEVVVRDRNDDPPLGTRGEIVSVDGETTLCRIRIGEDSECIEVENLRLVFADDGQHVITRTSFRDGAIMHEYVERTTAAGEALPGWTVTEDATARGSMAPVVWGGLLPPAVAVFDHDADSISIRQNGMHTTIANEASAVHKYLGVGADERSMLRERLLRQVRRAVGFQWLVGRGTQVVVGTVGRVVTGERAYVDPNADDLLRGWSTSQCPGFVWAGTWMRPVSNTPDMAIVELGGELFEGGA